MVSNLLAFFLVANPLLSTPFNSKKLSKNLLLFYLSICCDSLLRYVTIEVTSDLRYFISYRKHQTIYASYCQCPTCWATSSLRIFLGACPCHVRSYNMDSGINSIELLFCGCTTNSCEGLIFSLIGRYTNLQHEIDRELDYVSQINIGTNTPVNSFSLSISCKQHTKDGTPPLKKNRNITSFNEPTTNHKENNYYSVYYT
ncbi:hypothetical protein U3516DRAFT_754644 [Neocallimastix sp. 'constans']